MINDITERKQAEQVLRENEILLNFALDSTVDGIWNWDAANNNVAFSKRWQEMLGYADGELENDIGFWEALIHPDDLVTMNHQLKAYFEGTAEKYEILPRILGKNGKYHHIKERGIIVARDAQGRPTRMVGTMKNIEPELRAAQEAEQKLRASETKFQRVFEMMPIGLGIFSPDRSLTQYNARLREMSGLNDDELKAGEGRKRTYWNTAGAPIPDAELPIARALATGEKISGEIFGIHTGQHITWVSASVQPINELGIYVGTLSDVTEVTNTRRYLAEANNDLERRVAERTRELTEVNAELEAFSYSVSHDLRAPITRIESWVNAFSADSGSQISSKASEYLQRIKTETRRMNRMIKHLIALAKAAAAAMVMQKLDLTALANRIIADLRFEFPQTTIVAKIADGLEAVGDPTLVEILLRNLLHNAVKFSTRKEQSIVEFGTAAMDAAPAFFVRDNGAGFDMAYADKLFAPFQRMHNESEFSGTGIGLATVQRIVHRHSGRVRIESQYDMGTTVFFTLHSTPGAMS